MLTLMLIILKSGRVLTRTTNETDLLDQSGIRSESASDRNDCADDNTVQLIDDSSIAMIDGDVFLYRREMERSDGKIASINHHYQCQ